MRHISNRLPPTDTRVSDTVISVLSTSILVLAGIVSLAQFAYL
jgi:hypothetical protein